MQFSELGLDAPILDAIAASGYENATPVQQQAIPAALTGQDLLVSSHTGSGKTAAFLLPSIQRLQAEPKVKSIGPRVLVLAPTRELALQVEKAAMNYGNALKRFRTACLVGGAPYGIQLKRLSSPVDLVVATPGRLIDHLERGKIDFSRLEVLVLDEADRMLDMGFIDDIQTIAGRCPAERQTLLFSATLDGVVGNLARELTKDALRIEIEAAPKQEAKIAERLLYSDNMDHKQRLLDALLRDAELTQAIVFAATKRSAEEISDLLADSGFASDTLHGDMQQGQRNRALQRLRDGRTKVLVATDVAARGIDIAGISHVINFDLPRQAEDYVHRIGRTGRAGREGMAWSFAGMREGGLVKNIERYTGRRIDVHTLPGLEPQQKPQGPRDNKRGGRPGGNRNGGGQRGFGDKRGWNNEARGPGEQGGERRQNFGDGERRQGFGDGERRQWNNDQPRQYGDRPARGENRDNRDRGFRADRPAGDRQWTDRPPRQGQDRGNRPNWDERQPRVDPRAASQDFGPRRYWDESKPEVDGNSVEYWEKREREARANADRARQGRPGGGNKGGNFGGQKAQGQGPRGQTHSANGHRPAYGGVRGRFKD